MEKQKMVLCQEASLGRAQPWIPQPEAHCGRCSCPGSKVAEQFRTES